jgi:SAM-dependent methyltransferase
MMADDEDVVLGPGDDYVHHEPAFALLRDRIGPDDTVLDIGCGFGNVGRFLARTGAAVDGIEPDDERAPVAGTALRHVFHGSLEDASSAPDLRERYSVVTVLDVVEHFADPLAALRLATDLLDTDGRLFLFIPNSAHWSFRKKMLRGNWAYSDWGLFDRTHLRFFDLATSVQLIADAGLVEVQRWYTTPQARPLVEKAAQRFPELFALHFLFELRRG